VFRSFYPNLVERNVGQKSKKNFPASDVYFEVGMVLLKYGGKK
jgi:hypothetical protein